MAHPNKEHGKRKKLLIEAKSNLASISDLFKNDIIVGDACDKIKSKILTELDDIQISEMIYNNNKNYRR